MRGVVDLILLIGEPLRRTGPYDFGRSTLPARVRELGVDLAFRRGFLRAPPPETVFLHRKLVGSFLLCARIRARVDTNALIRPLIGLGDPSPRISPAPPPPPGRRGAPAR